MTKILGALGNEHSLLQKCHVHNRTVLLRRASHVHEKLHGISAAELSLLHTCSFSCTRGLSQQDCANVYMTFIQQAVFHHPEPLVLC